MMREYSENADSLQGSCSKLTDRITNIVLYFHCLSSVSLTILAAQTHSMKTKTLLTVVPVMMLLVAPAAFGAETTTVATWHAQTLGQALLNMLVFAGAGMIAAIAGFKLFDLCTPGNLAKEILENKNIAAAIVSAAVILGVCIIVAAAMFS
jgi:hypothetical protein